MRYWIKLYTEILKDPKMGRLTDRQFRTCINLFALAGEHDQEGALPSVADMSWTLRMDETELLDNLNELAKVGIVRCINDTWLVCKWQERQAKAPSAAPDKVLQRVHDYRQRQRNESVTTLQDEVKRGVTPPETETDIETETETDTESERGATFTPGPVVARASVTRTTGTKPNPKLSPQVNLFAKVTGFYPARSVHHIVDAAIDTRNDEALLRQCYEAWLLRGFRKENLAWLTEWYTSGGVPTIQRSNGNNGSSHTRADTRDGYNIPAGYEGLVNTDARTVTAPDPWRDLLAEADALAPMVRQTPQVKERTLKQLARKLDGMLAALPVPYDAALATLGERLA